MNLSAVVAFQLTDWLDIGAGFDAQYTDAELTSALPNLPTAGAGGLTFPTTDGFNSLKGDGWDYGWNVGAQAHFGALDLGVSYRSAIDHELDGDISVSGLTGALAAGGANFAGAGTATFSTPWFATISARYHVNDRLTLNAQVNQIGWSEFDAIRVDAERDSIIEQNYDDVTTGAIGFDYVIDPTPDGSRRRRLRPDPDPGRPAHRPYPGRRPLLGLGRPDQGNQSRHDAGRRGDLHRHRRHRDFRRPRGDQCGAAGVHHLQPAR